MGQARGHIVGRAREMGSLVEAIFRNYNVSHFILRKKKMSSRAFPRTARMVKYNTIYSMTKSIKRCGRKRRLKETFDEV